MTTFPAHPLLLTLKPSALGSSETGTITPICQIGKGRVGNAEKPAHNHTETKQRKLWAYDTCHAPEAISGCHSKGPGPQPLQRSGAISGSYWLKRSPRFLLEVFSHFKCENLAPLMRFQKFPNTLVSLEGNTEVPGMTSSEPLLPS